MSHHHLLLPPQLETFIPLEKQFSTAHRRSSWSIKTSLSSFAALLMRLRRFLLLALILLISFSFLLLTKMSAVPHVNTVDLSTLEEIRRVCKTPVKYNSTYPITPCTTFRNTRSYRIGCVADQDLLSPASGGAMRSYLLGGQVNVTPCSSCGNSRFEVSVHFDDAPSELLTDYAFKGRGAELSDLVVFNGKLYTCDDRTGILFEVTRQKSLVPWLIFADGDGHTTAKGLKCEWMTTVDDKLVVGGFGKEWTTKDGKVLNYDPTYVKVVTPDGVVSHLAWNHRYQKLRSALNISYPGYFILEAVVYSPIRNTWLILPRRMSTERYNDELDMSRGTNLIVEVDSNFNILRKTTIGEHVPRRGFSSAKFVPGTNDEVVIALRTAEISDNEMTTHYTVFTVGGQVLIEESLLSDSVKYEGIEFT